MISVQNVTKRYGDTVGVQDVSFEVGEGEILGFLGPNGAGKTTTMRVITGYHPPTSGTVTVAGYDIVTQSHEAKRHLGYLPENPPLYADMTVAEYLHFVAALKEVPRKERRGQIDEIVDMLNLGPVYQRLIRNISKGYRQRVGLAQALVGRPPVLILDEPTVGLDPKQIHEVRQVIKSLGGRHTIILSSHILPEVSMVCQRIAIINKGRIVAVDHPETLSSRLRGTPGSSPGSKATRKGCGRRCSRSTGCFRWRTTSRRRARTAPPGTRSRWKGRRTCGATSSLPWPPSKRPSWNCGRWR